MEDQEKQALRSRLKMIQAELDHLNKNQHVLEIDCDRWDELIKEQEEIFKFLNIKEV